MDYPTFFLFLSLFSACVYALAITGRRNSRLPPGPYPFLIIGNLLELGNQPHRSLASLSKCYGPLMSLKLGSRTTIVVSSPHIAKQFFHTHDTSFSGRTVPLAAHVVDHHKYSIVFLPVGDHWRRLRRVTKEYLFSMQRLEASQHLRGQKVQELVDHVNRCCTNKKAVNIGGVGFTTTLNILSNFLFSIDFARLDSESSQELKEAVWGLMELAGKPNLADFFPILKPLDPQGLLRRANVYGKKLMTSFDRIIDQRLQQRPSHNYDGAKNDILDLLLHLLNQKDEPGFSRDDMRHLFFALFIVGTDTTSNTFEWAMTELIRNPEKMEITRSEIVKYMQNNDRNIQERDISRIPYLQAVIKETLRLHPPVPFLVPRQAMLDIEVQGFFVPKNSQILCNVWAMGRDPNVWSDPEAFMPERFLKAEIDYKGQDFELIPFGAGRRICPGLNIAHKMLHMMLGSMIRNFDWKLHGNMKSHGMDMGEKFGLTLQRNMPLMAIPIKP